MARHTLWLDTLIDVSIADGARNVVSLMGGASVADVRNITLVRTVFDLWLCSATVAGAYGVHIVDIGMGITSQEAFLVGVLADPDTQADQPARGWIYRTRCPVTQNGISTSIVHRC